MPDDKLTAVAKDPRAQSVALALIASAIFVTATKVEPGDPEREDKLAALGDALKAQDRATKTQAASANKLDTAVLGAEIRKLLGECGTGCVNLGAELVGPGATLTTGVTIDGKVKLVAFESCDGHLEAESLVCVLDPGAWTFTKAECSERGADTWCEVTARNTGDKAQRLLVLVRTEVVP